MDRQELVKHIQWKDLNIIVLIHKEVSYQEQLKKYLNIFLMDLMNQLHLWLELVIFKFIMKSLVIY